MRHPDDMKEKRKLNKNVICHDMPGMPSYDLTLTTPPLSPTETTTMSTTLPPTMTTREVGKALASLATSSTPQPLLGIWRSQRPTFRVAPLLYSETKPSADPHFWKMVAHAWADDFLYRTYVRQERKRALLASLPGTLPIPTPPSSSREATTKTTTSSADDATIPSPIATAVPPCFPHASTSKKTMKKPKFPPLKIPTKKNRPVEVRVGRGVGGEADEGRGIQAHHRRMYAPGTPQRAMRRSLSPTPDGFICNHGQNYVPLRIPVTSGRGVAMAKWVKVCMGVNPTAWGCMYKGGVIYQGDVHASPIRDCGATPGLQQRAIAPPPQ
jgi:hypothetical protein